MVFMCNRGQVDLKKFYDNQNDLVNAWKEDEKVFTATVDQAALSEQERRVKLWDTRLATITVIANIILIVAKTTAVALSDSLSVVASLVDSAMDITSGLVVWYTCRLIERSNKHHYPVGLNRLEPLTTLIFGLIMIFANVFVLQEAAVDAITGNLNPKIDLLTLIILCSGAAMKLVLLIILRSRNTSACRVLAIEQRNDFVTNLVALGGAFIGDKYWKYADPIGAVIVSGIIVISWLVTVKEQVPLLIGKTASPQLINRIVNVAISHDDRIKKLDTVYVYHFGANFLVELHIVMDCEITLREAHDVTETLENKLEQLSFVERAFVHCDYQPGGDEHV